MRRMFLLILSVLALTAVIAAPVSAKSFQLLYAEGETFRTFGNQARVDPGTGTDPIYTFENSTNPDQLSVARYAPGQGSHGGSWAVHHVTWTTGDRSTLITSFEQLEEHRLAGELTIVRDEAADFRCPILPNPKS
jgi:hypothetical protein